MHSNSSPSDQSTASFIEKTRRAQIISCTIETIATLGLPKASLAQIASRAGITPGVILYYFAGKAELISAVAAHVFAEGEVFVRARMDTSSPRAALASFITGNAAYMAEHAASITALLAIRRAGTLPALMPEVTAGRRGAVQNILQTGQDKGAFRAFSVPVMATAIIGALDALIIASTAPPIDLATAGAELAEIFARATETTAP
jgi:AcrR family transcriptional regulator